MKSELKITKGIVCLFFVLIMLIGCFRIDAIRVLQNVSTYLNQDPNKEIDEAETERIDIDSIEENIVSSIWCKDDLIELNGKVASILNMQGYFADSNIYVTDDDYIISRYKKTSTDYEYEQTVSLYQFCKGNGINLLYVNEPTKYIDDQVFTDEFGIESYTNRNADLFLERIREAGVPTLDLRDNIRDEGIDSFSLFYRTDHHWTTMAALWALPKIADSMNKYCGYKIDTDMYDSDKYSIIEYKNSWLGEQGRKIGESYIGLDDYYEIIPRYETNYTFFNQGKEVSGDFTDFINEEIYSSAEDVYTVRSWHYSYSQRKCINNNVEYGKVLIIGDSFEQITEPLLSLSVHETESIILRNQKDEFNLREYIINGNYDTVIITYAQFMIGAHDNPDSANFKMFKFE